MTPQKAVLNFLLPPGPSTVPGTRGLLTKCQDGGAGRGGACPQPGAGRGWLRWPGLGPQCPAWAWVGVVRGTGSGARMPELYGTEQVAGLSVPHIFPCEWGDNAREYFVGVQGDVRAQDPPPFCLANWWPGPMLLCGGGPHLQKACRHSRSTTASPGASTE